MIKGMNLVAMQMNVARNMIGRKKKKKGDAYENKMAGKEHANPHTIKEYARAGLRKEHKIRHPLRTS
jgi:hypothetical protein